MLQDNKGAFAYSMQDLPGYQGATFEIKLVHDRPIFTARRQHSALETKIQDEKNGELLQAGFIHEVDSRSKYAMESTFPAKKDADGNWVETRQCLDARRINEATVTDAYSLPLPEELFQRVQGSTVFSGLDMRSGFFQLRVAEDSQKYTTFWWGNKLYAYSRMPFGFKNATAAFQRVMDTVLRDAGLTHCAAAFVDDVIIYSSSMEEHVQHVDAVLRALAAVGLRVHPAKSIFAAAKIEYLGHVVTPGGLEPQAAKVAAMAQLPIPSTVAELRSALGLLNYYRCYIPQFSSIAKPLNELCLLYTSDAAAKA